MAEAKLADIIHSGRTTPMKRILCYGDSNTWGYDPVTGDRFDAHTRWTRILAKALGAGYEIIEEGLNGRTTVWDDPIEGDKNGKTYLMPCLATHRPLDLVILMLGTNDLKHRFSLTAFDIAEGAKVLGQTIQTSACTSGRTAPPLLLMAPAPLATLTDLDEMFLGGEKKVTSVRATLFPRRQGTRMPFPECGRSRSIQSD